MLIPFIFILIAYFGYLLSLIIVKVIPTFERIGLSYLLGVGVITFLMFLYSWIGIRITLVSVLVATLVLITVFQLICGLLKRKIEIRLPNIINIIKNFSKREKIMLYVIILTLVLSLGFTIYFPVSAWDALALYDFRAKIIAQTGYFVQISNQFSYFSQYPLLTSLTHTIVYLAGGNNPQFTYSLYLISFALIFFSAVRRNSSRFIALLATLFMITGPRLFEHSTIAYTNLPYTVFYVVGIIYLYFSITEDRYDYLFLSSLLIGLSTWARSDLPFWATAVFIALGYSIYKKSFRPLLTFLPALLLIQQPWNAYQAQLFGVTYSTSGQFGVVGTLLSNGINFGKIMEVVGYIYQNVILSWGASFVLFVIFLLVDIKNRFDKRSLILISIIALNLSVLFVGTYVFSINIKEWKDIADSARRIAMFFVPLMLFYSAYVFSKYFEKGEETRKK